MRRRSVVLGLMLGLVGAFAGGPRALAGGSAPAVFGGVLPIDVDAEQDQVPNVAWNPECPTANQFLSVWQGAPDAGDFDVYGRFTDGTGTVLGGPEIDFTKFENAGQVSPNVAYNSAAGAPEPSFVLVYDDPWPYFGDDIAYELVDCDGVLISGGFLTTDGAVIGDIIPDVACGTTVCWIVWEQVFAGPTYRVTGRAIDGAGNVVGGANMSQGGPNAQMVSIAANGVNGCAADSFLAVWQDRRLGTWDVAARELDDVGICGPIVGVAGGAGDQTQPDVAFGTANGFYEVVWQDGANIYGKITNPDGTPAGGRVNISIAANQQLLPAVAYDSVANRFLTAYQDLRPGDFDVFGRLTNGAGGLMGGSFRFPSTMDSAQRTAVAFSTDAAHFYVNWDVNADDIRGAAYW